MINKDNIKFRYVIVKHEKERFSIHEAYTDLNDNVIAVFGEPVTLHGYSSRELFDMINRVANDTSGMVAVKGNLEQLYDNYDKIIDKSYALTLPEVVHSETNTLAEIIEFKR